MSIELYFSNRLEKLAEKFASTVDLENRRKENIFKAPLVIVPNANLVKWLQLMLARKRSVCMNMDFQFLETGLWNLLANLDDEKLNPKLFDKNCLQMLLLYALQNLDENRIEFEPINRYLISADKIKRPDYAGRLWQLSEKFAHLFQEYEFHRYDMIQKWRQNKVVPKGMELSEQKLYLLANELRDKLFHNSGALYLSMMEYADRLFAGEKEEKGIAGNGNNFVHFFGLSQISPFHLQLIGRLKDYYKIFIYAFNPSREFWEDIKTPQERRWIERKNVKKLEITSAEMHEGELSGKDDSGRGDNELLSLWGKPGRESIRLLCELTDYDFHACFAKEETPATVLQKIQSDILTLPSEKSGPKYLNQDRSLQIVSCPGTYREVETVYNSILYNLEQNNRLQLTDIAILVPDISKYKFVFNSVFNRYPKSLSYNLVDSHAEIESIFGRGVLSIFDFATGRFSRREVFDLILNPCFMSKWKIGLEEIRVWADWAQELNIFHDFDQRSKKEKGYCESPCYTWKQGLQRLRLSRIMSNPVESENAVSGSHFQDIVPYFDLNTGDVDLMEKFCAVIEKLHNVALDLNDVPLSGKEWKGRFLKACDELLDIPSEFAGETAVKHSLINVLDNLQFYDAISEDDRGSKLDIELIKEFIKSGLSSISGGYGDYLTDGVTISALQPMRPIPFKIVYILGMEEGSFPGKAESSSLDIRLLKRRIGDISRPERNCYIFLEMLLSTRDKLYISYISKDLQKDRILQPCSVVNQLRRYVEKEILPDGRLFQTAEIPLKGSSNRYLDKDSADDCFDVLVNYSMADRLIYYRENKLWQQVEKKALKDDLSNAASFDPDFRQEIEAVEEDDITAEKITLKQLKKFLEDPVSQSIKHNLGIYDEKESVEEIVLSEDEPFYSDFPIDYRLKMEPLKQWLDSFFSSKGNNADAKEIEEIYNLAYDNFLRQSKTPEGLFAALDKNELKAEVLKKAETISSVLKGIRSSNALYRAFYIGEPEDDYSLRISQGVVKYFSPLTLTVKATNSRSEDIQCKVELHGQLPWVWKENGGEWHALVLSGSYNKPGKKPDKYILEPVLFYMFCLAGDESYEWIGSNCITFHIVYKEDIKTWVYKISKRIAVNYLQQLLADYLGQQELEWLPFKAATSGNVKPYKITEDKITEDIKTNFQIQFEDAISKYEDDLIKKNKATIIKLVKPEIPSNAFDRARQRFQIFFDNINR